MSESPPVARSPIAAVDPTERDGWVVSARRSTADLTVSDETPLVKIAVRGPVEGAVRAALGTRFGRAVHTTVGPVPALVVGSGPGEWLVLGAPTAGPDLLAAVRAAVGETGVFTSVDGRAPLPACSPDRFVSVVDLTHGRALIRLTGRRGADVLAKLCGIDLGEVTTPNGAALRSSVATVVTDLVRDDVDGTPSYLLHVERSVGQFLVDAVLDAGAGYGIDTTTLAGLGPSGAAAVTR